MRRRKAGVVRISREVLQTPVGRSAIAADGLGWMQQHRPAALLALGVNRPQCLVVEFFVSFKGGWKIDGSHSGQLGRPVQFFYREFGRLNGKRRGEQESLGMRT